MSTPSEAAMQDRLVRVETKLDILIADLGPRHLDHESRLRALERDMAMLKTKVAFWSAGLGTAAGVVTTLVVNLISA